MRSYGAENRTTITSPRQRISNVIVGANRISTRGVPLIDFTDELENCDVDLQLNSITSNEYWWVDTTRIIN